MGGHRSKGNRMRAKARLCATKSALWAVMFLRPILRIIILSLWTCAPPLRAQGTEARPNILWLIAEDMGPALGCYGRKEVATPQLDKLAAEGVRFTRAYTTAPV